ncbi:MULTISPECIES: ImmA/IrrE family metallo-endopeptidase [unclassified Nostoc]|uniref:ImmA/IrrE family metallo-endopeptidase n=1 Tax=unclassified Nostoc TaxID=2593658 RepID=UPI002AD2442B|nr:ImmA/IrrE family metallo-endopeptidase [Nostoc sp. DedQUE03]MDZ7971740.1 ImmA/IrrE family metallo-endopeptidase [Nostoc sp. DedQUE03]MDZ8047316.1 ImmA/IrrE family metallo-endopeptidase [Nostoc sp. DedQUE02]
MSIIKQYRYIPDSEIEARANNILKRMQETPKYIPKWPLDATRVAEFLGLNVVWDRIPPDAEGQIAARILPLEHLIEINEDILKLPKGFEESTLAHELGHWELHIDQKTAGQFEELIKQGGKSEIDMQPFLCRAVSGQLQKMELQAQRFASYLLMPHSILEQMATERDLTKWSHLYAMQKDLGVTITNLKVRLVRLNWIILPPGDKTIYLGKAAPIRKK